METDMKKLFFALALLMGMCSLAQASTGVATSSALSVGAGSPQQIQHRPDGPRHMDNRRHMNDRRHARRAPPRRAVYRCRDGSRRAVARDCRRHGGVRSYR
jgi:hypothetical protein